MHTKLSAKPEKPNVYESCTTTIRKLKLSFSSLMEEVIFISGDMEGKIVLIFISYNSNLLITEL